MIDLILDKVVELLQNEPAMSVIKDWHKINGLIPGKHRSISIGVEEAKWNEYSGDYDECEADFKIYLYLDNRELVSCSRRGEEHRLEYGDRILREMVDNIRLILAQNYTLDGLIDVSHVEKVEFLTSEDYADLHIAVITFYTKFYAGRSGKLRNISVLLSVTGAKEGMITELPIIPVLDADITGLIKGRDYEVVPEGIKWLIDVLDNDYLISWKYSADSVKVEKIGMVINDEVTKLGEE